MTKHAFYLNNGVVTTSTSRGLINGTGTVGLNHNLHLKDDTEKFEYLKN